MMMKKKVASLIAFVTSSDVHHQLAFIALFCTSFILIYSVFFLVPPFNTTAIISPPPPPSALRFPLLTPSPSPALDPSPLDSNSGSPPIVRDDSSAAANAVFFRNAPWKAAIGHWFSRCYDAATPFSLTETTFGRLCPNNCSQNGICNHEEGQCRCFHGFEGPGCENLLNLECNLEPSTDWPYGRWVVSICSAFCDKRKAKCFCGSGSKYPERPVAEACGFSLSGTIVDWREPDWSNIFSNSSDKNGWCNVDPSDGYRGTAHYKEKCDCTYDGADGRFCEKATQCVCLNQCSGNGVCSGGFCQCTEGWYGVDCSIPSSQIASTSWPKWLGNGTLLPQETSFANATTTKTATIDKKHPLIYVYDLPPQFNTHLLEGRHWKFQCVNRIYDSENRTVWTPQLYGAEIAVYESLLASPHRTTNAEEADFFYVPVFGACLITRADDTPHLSMKEFMGFRSYTALDLYRKAYNHIRQSYPYWNRTDGRDHIWFFSWDEGACFAPKEIWNSMMLVHWGNTNAKHNYSTTGYFPDNWDHIPIAARGSHVCFDPEKDLVLPAWKVPDASLISERFWERPIFQRTTLFYFNGNLGHDYENGRPEPRYSMGIRQKLAREFGSSRNKDGVLGKNSTHDVIVTSVRSNTYSEELGSSKFCGVLPGDGWSGRMEDSILHGCIPVIIQDGIQLIYENVLDYDQFANMSETEVDSKLSVIQKMWPRFLYRDAILLEAQRQKQQLNKTSEWANAFATLVNDDDAFSTLIEVLHYKLYNDGWRQQRERRDGTLPNACVKV